MQYKENKDIMDLIKHIKEINYQINRPNENIRKVIADVQNSLKSESIVYELANANGDISKITTIDNIDINILYNKLPDYRALCHAKLLEKCGQELYNWIIKEENL